MNKIKIFLIIIFFFLLNGKGFSQKPTDLRINELFLNNIENLADEYGRHVPWIEIFNTSYNSVDIAECYLTNDTTGLSTGASSKWYRIPKGDPKTLIHRRGFLVFYLDNTPTYGVFHTNFNPQDSLSSNYIALISSNGSTIIDFFTFDSSLRSSSHSFGYKMDYGPTEVLIDGKMTPNLGELEYFTPGSQNNPETVETKSEVVAQKDKYGIGIILISMSVVFGALFLIFIVLKIFGRYIQKSTPRLKLHSAQSKKSIKKEEKIPEVVSEDDNGEVLAAISMAIYLHFNSAHDFESEIITIETPSTHFSPWAQKNLTHKTISRKR